MKTRIEVEITNVIVNQNRFSLHYKVTQDDELKVEGDYESSHAWRTEAERKTFHADILKGWGARLAINQLFK